MSKPSIFDPLVDEESRHRLFEYVRGSAQHHAARKELQRAFELLPSPDNNFIKDFQSTGFDARVWELYLAAFAHSEGLVLKQPHDRPDFLLQRGNTHVWVEAVTANPTEGKTAELSSDYWDQKDQIAAKLGSPLFSKLKKRYWELEHVKDTPLVLAIADFHDPDPFRGGPEPLQRYLYARHLRVTTEIGELPDYALDPIARLGSKGTPAGFFDLEGAENVSAVLFSNAGTVAKFNRMGFDSKLQRDVRMLRFGFSYDPFPLAIMPEPFAYVVGDAPEIWGQEVMIFHNPRARLPLPKDVFHSACQYYLEGNVFRHSGPDFLPFVSQTHNLHASPDAIDEVEAALRAQGRAWVMHTRAKMPELERIAMDHHRRRSAPSSL